MINLEEFIEVLGMKDNYTFFINDTATMYINGKLKDSVLKLTYRELKSIFKELSNPVISNISVKNVCFDTDEYGGEYKIYLVVMDQNLKELQELNERRNLKIEQISLEIKEMERKLNRLLFCSDD